MTSPSENRRTITVGTLAGVTVGIVVGWGEEGAML
jgi:hypothetical protein